MKMNARVWAIAAAGVLLVAAIIAAAVYTSAPRGSSVYASVKITAAKTGPHGVETDSSFLITLERAVNEEALRAMLLVEPELEYTLSGGGKRWTLVPSALLTENMVYTFRIVDESGGAVRSFAFQTKSGLLVETAYPRPGASWVELETGIEFTFNTVGVEMKDFFTIEPQIAGEFRITEKSAVFVPNEPLLPNSVYRVTLKAGLTAANGMTLAEDYMFAFETLEEGGKRGYEDLHVMGSFDETFLPGDPVVLKMMGGDMTGVQMTLSVHRYADTQAYATELQKRAAFYSTRTGVKREYEVQTQTLEPAAEHVLELTPGDRWWSTSWVALPDGLPEGCYVLTLKGESPSGRAQLVQKLVQVCNVAAFTQAADGDAQVWLNDVKTGEPMAGARVQLLEQDGVEQRAGVTDENGVLMLRTDEMENAWLSVTDGGRLAYFGALELSVAREKALWEKYYAAVYKDRELYQPTDTLQLWGVLRPRGGEAPPKSITLTLGNGGRGERLYETRVELLADGTFAAELSFTGLEAGWYSLMLTDDGEGVYWSGSVQVQQFTKPPMVITAAADREWYYVGDTVSMTFTAAYYDGTPAAGAKLRFTCEELIGLGDAMAGAEAVEVEPLSGEAATGEEPDRMGVIVTLDGEGRGTYSARMDSKWTGWFPTTVFYEVQSADTQEVYLQTTGQLRVAPSRYTCEVTSPENGSLTVKTNRLNEAAMNEREENATPYEQYRSGFERLSGAAAELGITVEFMETVTSRVPDGEYYDELEKKAVTRYRNVYEDHMLRTEEIRTANGVVTLPYDSAWAEQEDDTRRYWVRVQFDGGLGRQIEEIYYFARGGWGEEDIRRYMFAPENAKSSFALGASVPLGLYERGKSVSNEGRVLYSIVQGGIRETALFTGNSASIPFREVDIPNIAVAGAYFDGRHVFQITPFELRYDIGERTLEVQVQADAASYAPGGEAKLTVTLRDAEGKPVAGTACVGVVDESIFALVPQDVGLVQQLYGNYSSTYVAQRSSYKEYNLTRSIDEGGGMGGGGGDGEAAMRQDFVDTALFKTVSVDESGTATVALTLPDNITKWRVTAAAVTADGKAGDGKGDAVATLPFYLRVTLTDAYLAGDDVTLGVLAVGTELQKGAAVDYAAELLGEDGKQIAQKAWQATAEKQTYASFGKVPEGQYVMRVTAKSGEYSDGMERPVAVVKTGAVVRLTQRVELAELSGMKPERWPAVVNIYDTRLEPYMESLRVLSGRAGARTEILAASYRAQVAQNELLPEDERRDVPKSDRLFALQDYESGMKPLPNAEPDAALTAKLLLSAPQLVNEEFARQYLKNVLKDPAAAQESRLMAYVGLAALREPVMLDIARLLENEALTASQRLYLGAGLAALGDFDGAQAMYDGIAVQSGKTEGARRWIEGADTNERQKNTGAALLLCSIAGHADADALANELCAVMKERPREDANVLTDLELLAYTRYFRLGAAEPAAFSYVRDGKRETMGLGQTGAKTLSLSAEAFAEADVKAVTGKLVAEICYSASAPLPEEMPDGMVTVRKTVTSLEGGMRAPGLARVEITVKFSPNAPEGVYEVFDAIPSGLRFLPNPMGDMVARTDGWQMGMENEGQQMRGSVWLWRESDHPMPLTEDGPGMARPTMNTMDGAALAKDPGMEATVELAKDPGMEVSSEEEAEVDTIVEPKVSVNPSTVENPSTEDPTEVNSGEYVLTYYVNCTLPGGYVLESAYVTDTQGAIIAVTPRRELEIW